MMKMMINSLLDTDLYKLSMQQAVMQHYPTANVTYAFTNRNVNESLFNRSTFDAIQSQIKMLEALSLSQEELDWLRLKCSAFFTPAYLDFLSTFKFDPVKEIRSTFISRYVDAKGIEWGELSLVVSGAWKQVILYEVPVMAIISESYFAGVDLEWDYRGQLALAEEKGRTLFDAGCMVSEFGTRRRRSHLAQSIALEGLIRASSASRPQSPSSSSTTLSSSIAKPTRGKLSGTSNVHFAMKLDLMPIGTIAHEWIMGIAAEDSEGYTGSNSRAMDKWELSFPSGALSIMLTDTFSTAPFFDDFISDPQRARRWRGLRHDSGDAVLFIAKAKEAFVRVGDDCSKKLLVFSDGLNVERCLDLKRRTDEAGMLSSFGIGTAFTNDFQHVEVPNEEYRHQGAGAIRLADTSSKAKSGISKALNMVIKLSSINGKFTIKISDDLSKNTGDPETVRLAKESFGLIPLVSSA